MIAEATIEQSLLKLDDEAAIEAAMLEFVSEQVTFTQYLRTDTFELLTEGERDYLQYLALVIYGAVRAEHSSIPTLDGDAIETWEERCWAWLEPTVGKPMAQRLDVVFENIDQEELLAFAEDSLVDPDRDDSGEEASDLFETGPSRELGMVALVTLIGALDEVLPQGR